MLGCFGPRRKDPTLSQTQSTDPPINGGLLLTSPSAAAENQNETTSPNEFGSNTATEPPTPTPTQGSASHPTAATTNVKYSFTQVSATAMTLVSQPDHKFHISVESNCFLPSASCTIIREGGTEDGDVVAEFLLGSFPPDVTVCIRGRERLLSSILKYVKLAQYAPYYRIAHWQFGDVNLYWYVDHWASSQKKLALQCHDAAKVPRTKAALLAEFKTSNGARRGRDYLATLEVTPEGHREGLLDHILVSALILGRLILERRARGDVKRGNGSNVSEILGAFNNILDLALDNNN
ncbi:hypothetical protein V5O48_016096 [Marasmius crinis-equi]|uniref:Uncharacterized protein n=1 Tax=Marasmius crinis-equi TaxID=585013 RepID=A0ABR3ET11_9AGAR